MWCVRLAVQLVSVTDFRAATDSRSLFCSVCGGVPDMRVPDMRVRQHQQTSQWVSMGMNTSCHSTGTNISLT